MGESIRNLISILDMSIEEIDHLIQVADDIVANPKEYIDICKGKKLATLFFEPSTRTRLSFEAAMLELGGSVLGFSEASSSSAAKGESVSDTVRTVGCYADIIACLLYTSALIWKMYWKYLKLQLLSEWMRCR